MEKWGYYFMENIGDRSYSAKKEFKGKNKAKTILRPSSNFFVVTFVNWNFLIFIIDNQLMF